MDGIGEHLNKVKVRIVFLVFPEGLNHVLWGHKSHPGQGFQSQFSFHGRCVLLQMEVQVWREANTRTMAHTGSALELTNAPTSAPMAPFEAMDLLSGGAWVSQALPHGHHHEPVINFPFSFVSHWGLVLKQ